MNQIPCDCANNICQVLVVDESASLRGIYRGYLEALVGGPVKVHLACNTEEAGSIIDQNRVDLVILDLCLNKFSDHQLIKTIREKWPETVILAVAISSTLDTAVDAMRAGATDILIKPLNRDKLRHAIVKMVSVKASKSENKIEDVNSKFGADNGFIGTSPAMQVIYKTISVAAPSNATVFITGESGTGKELYADAIHRHSGRADKSIISLNCSAIPRDLIESEIFGHVRGAFTGAVGNRDGAAILADGGTLFLDEICEMDLALQAKLLRFIQTSTVKRVGDSVSQNVDVRFVCATNRNLLDEVAAGRFREDLYYRLHVIPVQMPPLREREGDIRLLAEVFLERFSVAEKKEFSGFKADALKLMEDYYWPGNVRQLENFIQNIVVMNEGGQITCDMLLQTFSSSDIHGLPGFEAPNEVAPEQEHLSAPQPAHTSALRVISNVAEPMVPAALPPHTSAKADRLSIRPLWVEEKEIIERAIAICDGNTVVAAAMLEVSPSTLYRKIKTWTEDDLASSVSNIGAAGEKQVVNS